MQRTTLIFTAVVIPTFIPALASSGLSRANQLKTSTVAGIRPAGSGVAVTPEELGPYGTAAAETHRPTAGRLGPASFVLPHYCAFLIPVTGPGRIAITVSCQPTDRTVEARVFCPGTKGPVAHMVGKGTLSLTVPWAHTAGGPRPRTGDWMLELRTISGQGITGPQNGPSVVVQQGQEQPHGQRSNTSSRSLHIRSEKNERKPISGLRQRGQSVTQIKPIQVQPRDQSGASASLTTGTVTVRGPGLGGKALVNITARQAELSRALVTAREELEAIRAWQLQWDEVDVKQILGEWIVFNADDLADSIKSTEDSIEELRNKRDEFTDAFENMNQKANQLVNLMSQLQKMLHDMRLAAIRNMQ